MGCTIATTERQLTAVVKAEAALARMPEVPRGSRAVGNAVRRCRAEGLTPAGINWEIYGATQDADLYVLLA